MEKITLYINGQPADLNEESLLLFTYQFADLERPAAVLNSYSREVVLPPTERNNRIFAELWRADRTGSEGYDTLARVPFIIRADSGQQLESGYVKLNGASAREGFDVSLFGGLGGLFYCLMQDEDGNKKSLASLDFGADLTFTINAATIREAWAQLYDGGKWGIINFAPMDNGLPEGDFDAGKALVPVGSAKVQPQSGESGKEGYALVTMPREHTEWAVRDLRSYLQRPVISMAAVLNAIEGEAAAAGYTFDWSDVRGSLGARTWAALPMLTDINFNKVSEDLDIILPATPVTSGTTIASEIYTDIPAGAKCSVTVTAALRLASAFASGSAGLAEWQLTGYQPGRYTVIFVQLLGTDAAGTVVAGSPVLALYPPKDKRWDWQSPKEVAKSCGYKPQWGNDFAVQEQGTMAVSGGTCTTDAFSLSLEAYGLKYLRLHIVGATRRVVGGGGGSGYIWSRAQSYLRLFRPSSTAAAALNSFTYLQSDIAATFETATKVRSGSTITKENLLGGTDAPGDYLLGLAKVFGWVFAYDGDTRTVRVLNRDTFFAGITDDIDARIDRSRELTIRPDIIEERWLQFSLEPTEADWAGQYADKYGYDYGAQRVNTGSPFNRETADVLEGTPFRAAVGELRSSRYFYAVNDGGVLLPGPWLDNDLKYTLWGNSSQDPIEHNIAPVSGAASLIPLPNEELATDVPGGYDAWYRVQARDADDRPVDVKGALLLLDARTPMEAVNITDDTDAMLNANGGVPCWLPNLGDPSDADNTGEWVAHFIPWTFEYSRGGTVLESVDMGRPQEVDAPGLYYQEGLSIYDRRWRAFIAERYDREARVCECYVDWSGYRVSQALFRCFYWFDGCRWALNKVEDYDIATGAPCKCTFVRVQNTSAYTGGQS